MDLIAVYGGGDRVGGSCIVYNHELMVDYGAIQNEGKQVKLPCLDSEVIKDLKVFILSHGHLDHLFGAPVIARENPNVVFVMTHITRDCVEAQLRDSINIALKNRRFAALEGRGLEPMLFDSADVDNFLSRIRCIEDEDWFTMPELPGYRFSLRSAGHMPGAAIICMITPHGKKIIHACDYCVNDQALIKGAKVPADFLAPDMLITESTYGDRELPDRVREEERLIEIVKNTLWNNGNVLLPLYSTTALNAMLPLARAGVPAFLDGMARQYWSIFRNARKWSSNDVAIENEVYEYLECIDGGDPSGDHDFREWLMTNFRPFCVGSPSGRLDGGLAPAYAEVFVEDERNTIILCGYQGDPDSRGNQLLRLAKGEEITFKHDYISRGKVVQKSTTCKIYCKVEQLRLSGHSDGDHMADWICQINPQTVITVHGDTSAHNGLAKRINKRNAGIRVESGYNGREVIF